MGGASFHDEVEDFSGDVNLLHEGLAGEVRGDAFVLCLLLLVARLSHWIAFSRENTVNPLRAIGVVLTVLVIAAAAIILIIQFFRIAPVMM